MTVRIGLGTFSGQIVPDGPTVARTYEEVVSLAVAADQAGFDSFWVSEHHGTSNAHLPSPLMLLAAVAGVTARIELGTAMAIAPLQHPIRFAEDCAVLDQVAGGRLVVGMAIGWRQQEFDMFGVPISERVDRTTDLVRVCRAAWGDARGLCSGRTSAGAVVWPGPARRIPVMMGGRSPKAVARAGRLADGFIATGTAQRRLRLQEFQEHVAVFDDAARAAGRDPQQLTIGMQADVWVSSDGLLPDEVAEAMTNRFGAYVAWHAHQEGLTAGPSMAQVIADRVVCGTAAVVVERFRPWTEAFGDRQLLLMFRTHFPGMQVDVARECLHRLAGDVLPALRLATV